MVFRLAGTFLFIAALSAIAPMKVSAAPCNRPPPGTCAMGGALGDGCVAQAAGSILHVNFFTGYANQSGQTYVNCPSWNVAGVDYPVGYSSALASLKDPSQNVNLPSGCTYDSITNTVQCTTGGPLIVSGFNFALHNGIRLRVLGSNSVIITNNYFFSGPAIYGLRKMNANLVLIDANVLGSVDIEHNTFDGNYRSSGGNLAYLVEDDRKNGGTTTYRYNAFLNIPQKGFSIPAKSDVLVAYNYCEGLELAGPSHGECEIYGNREGIIQNVVENFNTYLEPANAFNFHGIGGVSGPMYVSTGQADQFYGFVDDGLSTGCGPAPCYDGQSGNILTDTQQQNGALAYGDRLLGLAPGTFVGDSSHGGARAQLTGSANFVGNAIGVRLNVLSVSSGSLALGSVISCPKGVPCGVINAPRITAKPVEGGYEISKAQTLPNSTALVAPAGNGGTYWLNIAQTLPPVYITGGTIFINTIISNNTIVTNTIGGTLGPCFKNNNCTTSVLIEISYSTYQNTTLSQNFVDATGVLHNFYAASAAICTNLPIWSGNTDMVTGALVGAFIGTCH